ncbi:MAG: hypothetical protein N4A49_03670 [Marinifilaceae bacterium]|jgi:hypothetical protein|nr:hypothetical protein [Marinifilaceae bacterium]
MKKIGFILILTSLFFYSCNNDNDDMDNNLVSEIENENNDIASIVNHTIDFGNIPGKTQISKKFTFYNKYGKEITIDSTSFSSNNFKLQDSYIDEIIQDKESIEIILSNNTNNEFAEITKITDSLYIYYDQTKFIVPIKANVIPYNGFDFEFIINSINIPDSKIGESSTGTLKLSTNYDFDAKITIKYPDGYSGTKDTIIINGHKETEIDIIFSPKENKEYKSNIVFETLFGYSLSTEINAGIILPHFKYINKFNSTPHYIRLGISDITKTNYDIKRADSNNTSLYDQRFTNQASISGNSVINTEDILLNYNDTLIIHQAENIISISFAKWDSEIPDDFLELCINLIDANSIFLGSNIEIIPPNLFANTKIKNLNYAFKDCTNLKSLPQDLLSHTTELVDIVGIFQGCQSLENIPPDLFVTNPNISDFSSVFAQTKIKIIPNDLFKNNTKAKSFNSTFLDCQSLSAIPADLFKSNIEVTDFTSTFKNCTALTEIPKNLFSNNSKVSSFESTFENATNISVIGENLFPSSWIIIGTDPHTDINNGTADVEFYKIFEGITSFTYKTTSDFANIPGTIKSNQFLRLYLDDASYATTPRTIEASDGIYVWAGGKVLSSVVGYDFMPGPGFWLKK